MGSVPTFLIWRYYDFERHWDTMAEIGPTWLWQSRWTMAGHKVTCTVCYCNAATESLYTMLFLMELKSAARNSQGFLQNKNRKDTIRCNARSLISLQLLLY